MSGKVELVRFTPEAQKEIDHLMSQVRLLEDKMHLAVRMYASALGKKGDYVLSDDNTTLVFTKEDTRPRVTK
jgi:hypothetical protein